MRFRHFLKIAFAGLVMLAAVGAGSAGKPATAAWVTEFDTDPEHLSSVGRNGYFILEPGFYRLLRGGGVELLVTVLDETKRVDGVETRVVEERESEDGELIEVSRNYFAIHKSTHDVLYFGEDVEMYRQGKVVSHEGSWRAGVNKARAGLVMPGEVRAGQRFYQEQAPGVAMDRFEILSTTETVKTPGGTFEKCLRTSDTSPMIKGMGEIKYFAPGIGLVKYENVLLVEHGFRKSSQGSKSGSGR